MLLQKQFLKLTFVTNNLLKAMILIVLHPGEY